MIWHYCTFLVGKLPLYGESVATVLSVNDKPWDFTLLPFSAHAMINILGRQGWELVNVSVSAESSSAEDSPVYEYTLKREFIKDKYAEIPASNSV